jgi:hypothetical protein
LTGGPPRRKARGVSHGWTSQPCHTRHCNMVTLLRDHATRLRETVTRPNRWV